MTGPVRIGRATNSNQTWSQGYKFAFAGAILDQTYGVRIETTSSLGTLG